MICAGGGFVDLFIGRILGLFGGGAGANILGCVWVGFSVWFLRCGGRILGGNLKKVIHRLWIELSTGLGVQVSFIVERWRINFYLRDAKII